MAGIQEFLEQLEEHGVPQDVIDGIKSEMDSSSLRKKIGEYEQRWKDEAEPAISFKSTHETLPKRKEALSRVGVDYDSVPKYGRKVLDAIPSDKLDDLDFVASYVKDEGFEAKIEPEQQQTEKPGSQQITEFLTSAGQGAPIRTGGEAAEEAFYRDLDSVPDGDKQAIRAVLEKHGRLVSDQG